MIYHIWDSNAYWCCVLSVLPGLSKSVRASCPSQNSLRIAKHGSSTIRSGKASTQHSLPAVNCADPLGSKIALPHASNEEQSFHKRRILPSWGFLVAVTLFWFLQQFSEVSTPFLHSPRCCVCRSTSHCNPQEHSMKLPQGAFVISWPRLEPDLLLGQKIRLLLLKPCNFAKTMENAGSKKWTLEGCLRNSHVLLDHIKVVDAEVILKIYRMLQLQKELFCHVHCLGCDAPPPRMPVVSKHLGWDSPALKMSCHPGGHLVTGILEREHWTRLTLLYVCASLFLHLSSPFKPRLGRVGHIGWYITFTKGHWHQQSKHYKFARHRNGPEICLNTFGCRDGQLFDRVLMAASHWTLTWNKVGNDTKKAANTY